MSVAMLELFGLMTIQHGKPKPGKGWSLVKVQRNPWGGDALQTERCPGQAKLTGREADIQALFVKTVSKASIARIMGVSGATRDHFVRSRHLTRHCQTDISAQARVMVCSNSVSIRILCGLVLVCFRTSLNRRCASQDNFHKRYDAVQKGGLTCNLSL